MARHLAIFSSRDSIEKILKGEKSVEVRFALEKIVPYQKIQKGDLILLKLSGGKIYGEAIVDNVLFYEDLTPEMVGKLRKEYYEEAGMEDEFWQRSGSKRFVSVVFLTKPKRFLAPLQYKKRDQRGWAILEREG